MIEPIQNPVFKCSKCGKEEVQQNVVATGIPDYWVCKECRDKMKKLVIKRTFYEDGYVEVEGSCDFCGQYPCRHGDPLGELTAMQSPLPLTPYWRKRWLTQEKFNQPLQLTPPSLVRTESKKRVRCSECQFQPQIKPMMAGLQPDLGDGYCEAADKIIVGFKNNRKSINQLRKCNAFKPKT